MLKPLGSHVVVEPVVQEEKTASGDELEGIDE